MPKYKNKFASPSYIEERVLDEKDEVIGTLRVKPVSILWKPKGGSKFYSVSMDKFASWITTPATKASKTGS